VKKLRLFVVRHGETAWSRERRFAGARDIPLSPEGVRQCEAVARALAGEPLGVVVASPLERARASAEIIAKPHRLPVTTDPAFAEMGFGAWEGLTREEVATSDPAAYAVWRTTPHQVRIEGAERLADVAQRVRIGVDELRQTHAGGVVLLVCHAIVARIIVTGALGMGFGQIWSVDATPAGISEIEYELTWATVHRMNTLAHLEALA
jgi:broad specificity phosphatase PhoE